MMKETEKSNLSQDEKLAAFLKNTGLVPSTDSLGQTIFVS